MARGGQNKNRDTSERRCIVTGDTQPKSGLLRFVVGPDDQIVADLLEKLPGRGIWVSADRHVLEQAIKKGLFARGAKQAVTVPDGLIDNIEAGLTQRVVDLISLARKASRAVMGYEKVKSWLTHERARVLIQASDGSGRGKSKLRPPRGQGRFYRNIDGQRIGFGFWTGKCDTWRACGWWTHKTCCRGSSKA